MSEERKPAATAAVRHAEARRVGTCRFADSVAEVSVAHYKRYVPEHFRSTQRQTCLATVVAHNSNSSATTDQRLNVLAMGVGTKFLSERLLRAAGAAALHNENSSDHREGSGARYGERVRDCHAEVLARRAFRRYLTDAIRRDLLSLRGRSTGGGNGLASSSSSSSSSILQRCDRDDDGIRTPRRVPPPPPSPPVRYQLKPGITLHFYCSSTPCGNSVLKKFATLQKEVFLDQLADDEWPDQPHESLPGHSIPLGQFALLVKKDSTSQREAGAATVKPVNKKRRNLSEKQQAWPVNCRTDWCPAGTTTVWSGQGSLHTCSDKLARWNCLGLQGSLLASLLLHQQPLYASSLTVGRKFSAATCRRAICCRLVDTKNNKACCRATVTAPQPRMSSRDGDATGDAADHYAPPPRVAFCLHHPAVMGTAVYMDEAGVLEMTEPSKREPGQDVRFHSPHSWASWLLADDNNYGVECIDGSTGFVAIDGEFTKKEGCLSLQSQISTAALLESFLEIQSAIQQSPKQSSSSWPARAVPATLDELRRFKKSISGAYEQAKNDLLTKHPVLRDWNRREEQSTDGE